MDKQERGFARMKRDQQRAIASLGGQMAQLKGTAHRWTSEEARAAGREGQRVLQQRRRAKQVCQP